MNLPRPCARNPKLGAQFNHIRLPSDAPSLRRSLVGSIANLAARTCGIFIQSSNGTALGLVGVGDLVLPQIPGDRLRHVRRRSRTFDQHPGLVAINGCAAVFNSLRRNDPWQDATQDCAESLGSVAPEVICTRHALQHEVSDVRQAEEVYPNPGEVCRERG